MSDFYAGLGRIVLYNVAAEGSPADYRAAMIVRVWGDPTNEQGAVNLLLFLDGNNDNTLTGVDKLVTGLGWATSRVHGEVGDAQRWIWPQELAASTS